MAYINIISGSKQVKGSLKVRGRKGLTKTECFIALELTMCSPKQRGMLPWTAMEGGEGSGERKGGVTGGYL